MNKRVSKAFGILFLLLEVIAVPKAIELILNQPFTELSPLGVITLSMTFGSLALCILMSFSSLGENDSYPLHTFLFELIVFLCFLAPLTELYTRYLDTAHMPEVNMVVNTIFYLLGVNIGYVILLYELLIIDTRSNTRLRKVKLLATFLVIIDCAATLLNVRFGYFFVLTAEGAYLSAPTFWLAYLGPLFLVIAIAVVAAREMQPGRQRNAFQLFWIFALVTSAIQGFIWRDLSIQYTGYTLSVLVIHLNVQSELDTSNMKISNQENSK